MSIYMVYTTYVYNNSSRTHHLLLLGRNYVLAIDARIIVEEVNSSGRIPTLLYWRIPNESHRITSSDIVFKILVVGKKVIMVAVGGTLRNDSNENGE